MEISNLQQSVCVCAVWVDLGLAELSMMIITCTSRSVPFIRRNDLFVPRSTIFTVYTTVNRMQIECEENEREKKHPENATIFQHIAIWLNRENWCAHFFNDFWIMSHTHTAHSTHTDVHCKHSMCQTHHHTFCHIAISSRCSLPPSYGWLHHHWCCNVFRMLKSVCNLSPLACKWNPKRRGKSHVIAHTNRLSIRLSVEPKMTPEKKYWKKVWESEWIEWSGKPEKHNTARCCSHIRFVSLNYSVHQRQKKNANELLCKYTNVFLSHVIYTHADTSSGADRERDDTIY